MNTVILGTAAELKKLASKKKYFVFTVLCALISLIYIAVPALVTKLTNGEFIIRANIAMSMLRLVTEALIPLISFMAVTDLFASEAQEDTMKACIMRPITRLKLMTSKSLAALIMAAISSLAVFVVCLILQLIAGGGIGYFGTALAAYLIDLIPAVSVVALAVLINMLAKSPALSMLMCIGVYVFFKYLNYYVSPIGQMVFTAYSQWHKLWMGNTLPIGALAAKTGFLFGSFLILYTVSYIIFDGKDY